MTRYVLKFTMSYNAYFYIEVDAIDMDDAAKLGEKLVEKLDADFLYVE